LLSSSSYGWITVLKSYIYRNNDISSEHHHPASSLQKQILTRTDTSKNTYTQLADQLRTDKLLRFVNPYSDGDMAPTPARAIAAALLAFACCGLGAVATDRAPIKWPRGVDATFYGGAVAPMPPPPWVYS
jgi:hypothetical protein